MSEVYYWSKRRHLLWSNKYLQLVQMNSHQLYLHNELEVPQLPPLQLAPFPEPHAAPQQQPSLQHSLQQLITRPPPTSHFWDYSHHFEQVCAKESLFPLMVRTSPNRLCVVCKDCIMLSEWVPNRDGQPQAGGDELISFTKWDRLKVAQVPTAVELGTFGLYVGYQSGRINQFLYRTRSWQGSCEELQLPILQLRVVGEEENKEGRVLGLDSAGNLVHFCFSHKTFLDKIIKTMVSTRWLSFMFKNKKREKIKKLFRKIMKQQPSDSQLTNDSLEPPVPYHYNALAIAHLQQQHLLALLRQSTLEILHLAPDYTLINTTVIDEPPETDKEAQGWVALGEGGFSNANARHNVLIVGRSNTLSFYRIVEAEDNFQVVRVSQTTMEQPLLFGRFISNSLFIVGNEQGLYLGTIGEMPNLLLAINSDKFSYIDFFVEEEGLEVDKNLLVGQRFGVLGGDSNGSSLFVVLEGKRLAVGSVLGWKAMLLDLILTSKWEESISLFHTIYLSHFKLLCGVNQNLAERNKEMVELCAVLAKGYLKWCIDKTKEEEGKREGEGQQHEAREEEHESKEMDVSLVKVGVKQRLNNLVYFLLRCDYAIVLFSQCQTLFPALNFDPLLLQTLKPYISQTNGLNLRIPYISEYYLNQVITLYKESKEQALLQRFIMQLDLSQMEPLLLLGLCLREELYRSLIGICCQQKDYITPIVKLCGIGYNNPLQHSKTSAITFWYLHECLEGRMTDYGNEANYLEMLAVLINFIFIPSSLDMLLAAGHQELIGTIYCFFQPKIMRLILENEGIFFMRKDQKAEPLFEDNCLSQFKLYESMLTALVKVVEESKQRENYEPEMYRLIVTLMLRNHFPFLANFTLRVIRYFIAHPLLLTRTHQHLAPELEETVNGQLMRLLDCLLRSIEDKCLSLREQGGSPSETGEIERLLLGEKERELTAILQQITLSESSVGLSQTKCYIQHQLGHYSRVVELYLRMANKTIRNKVFLYLQHNISKFKEVTAIFLKYLISLLGLEEDKTIHLLWKLNEEWVDHEEIIDRLVDHPQVQLKYIEKAMAGQKRTKKLLLKHLEIVLREHSEQVEEFIEKIEYPLEEAFRMCEESNNRMGKACILIKSGRNMEGVTIISEIFLESVREYLPLLRKTGAEDEDRVSLIMKQLGAVVGTCHKEWAIDNDRGEDIWEKNTEMIFKKLAVNNIDTPHVPEIIRGFLNAIITTLLSNMLEEVSTQFFLNRFVKTFSSLPQRLFMQAYTIIQHRLEFTFTLLKLNKDLVQQQELQIWRSLMPALYHAHVCALTCQICSLGITANQKMVTFQCQHVMHEQCYYQMEIKKTKNELCPLCYNPLESHMVCGEERPPRYRLLVDDQELLRVKLGKMSYYDRMKQMGEMEQFGEQHTETTL